jgi:hypothetical protein
MAAHKTFAKASVFVSPKHFQFNPLSMDYIAMVYQCAQTRAQTKGQLLSSLLPVHVVIAFVSLCTSLPGVAKGDELEDLLSQLAAVSNQSNGAPVANIFDINSIHGALVANSGNGSSGIMALNQDAGPSAATQANIVVVALTAAPNAAAVVRLTTQQVLEADQASAELAPSAGPHLSALAIIDSYKGGAGIAQINQNAGHGNIQRNATLIAAALGGGQATAITEADLSATSSLEATHSSTPGQRGIASISGSFTDFSGIVQVNQTIGSGNIVANTVSFTYGSAPAGGQ